MDSGQWSEVSGQWSEIILLVIPNECEESKRPSEIREVFWYTD